MTLLGLLLVLLAAIALVAVLLLADGLLHPACRWCGARYSPFGWHRHFVTRHLNSATDDQEIRL